jgi:hypothetical protein
VGGPKAGCSQLLKVGGLRQQFAGLFADLLHLHGSAHHPHGKDQKIDGEQKQRESHGGLDRKAADTPGCRSRAPKKFPETAQSGMYLESQYPSLFYRRGVYGITRFQCRSLSSGRRTGGPAVFI